MRRVDGNLIYEMAIWDNLPQVVIELRDAAAVN